TIRSRVGVTLFDLNISYRDPQLLGEDLRVGCLVPLPLRFRPEARNDLARRMDADLATIEHLDAQNIEVLRRTGPDDLSEARNTYTHQFAPLPLSGLLPAQLGVADLVHGQIEGAAIVAAVIFPTESGGVGKTFGLDEILFAELGRIHLQLVRHDIYYTLNRMHGLGHPEGTAVGNAAWRLIGIDSVDLNMRRSEVIGASTNVEQTSRKLGGIGRRIGIAVISERFNAQRSECAVPLRRQLSGDVIVASEGVGLQILHAVLDPLDRFPRQHR